PPEDREINQKGGALQAIKPDFCKKLFRNRFLSPRFSLDTILHCFPVTKTARYGKAFLFPAAGFLRAQK
ncbi:MAG: hypothetical protein CMN56_02845, partial [Sneathiella sp.]|uniref:hypothetical protein n=1 Tax=Sneathiella sp. TaxID=1964365 RepID=UPI000C4E43AB